MTLSSPLRPDVRFPTTRQVLILDDDEGVRAAALQCLGRQSCNVVAIAEREDARALARRYPADVVVLGSHEAGIGDTSSLLREAFDAPVVPLFRPSVYLRRRLTSNELGAGMMLGLADCRIRIGQHLASRVAPAEVSVRWGGFTLKLEPGAFAFQGKGLGLTRVQNAILSLLMLYGGQVVSRSLIEDAIFHDKPKSQSNFISVHVSRLRAKLRDSGSEVFIENVKGDGYALFWSRSFSADCMPEPELLSPEWAGRIPCARSLRC